MPQNGARESDKQEEMKQWLSRRGMLKSSGAVAAAGLLAGCNSNPDDDDSDGSSGDGGTNLDGDDDEFEVTFTQGVMPTTLDPHNHQTGTVKDVVLCAYDQLMWLNPVEEGELQPALATNWEWVDETTARLDIREGVTFHNGDEMTPEDVAYSINRIVDEDVGDLASPRLDSIPNVESAEAIDGEHAVQLNLDSRDVLLWQRLGNVGAIMPKGWVEENGSDHIARNMMGTGPYVLEEYDEAQHVILRKNEDYWATSDDDYYGWEPPADVITWNAAEEASTRISRLRADETDLVRDIPPDDADELEEEEDVGTAPVATNRPMFIYFNQSVDAFQNKEFRQALNYAVDVQEIIDEVLLGFGEPISQLTPDFWFGHNPDLEPYPYDPDRAEEMIDESGFAGTEFEITTPNGRYMKDVEVTQAVGGYIDELPNVDVTVTPVEYSNWSDSLQVGNVEDMPEATLLGWGSNPPDASVKFEGFMNCRDLGNYSMYCNEEIDDLVESSHQTQDEDERQELLQEANAIVHEECPILHLHWQYAIFGVSNRIKYEAPPTEEMWYGLIEQA